MTDNMPSVGDVVRIKEHASKVFGGCHAEVKAIDGQRVSVRVLAPSMGAFAGTWWFERHEISLNREDWP